MHLTAFFVFAFLFIQDCLAKPLARVVPLQDGMPDPSPSQLLEIEQRAHGTLSNMLPPANISKAGITNLQLIAFNELFEVAFFKQLLANITNEVEGFFLSEDDDRDFIVDSLSTILAQEEIHALTANNALKHVMTAQVLPCNYSFPVTSITNAIDFASTFTSVMLGTLQDITEISARNGDSALTRVVAAIIGNQGEQQGWYRVFMGKVPSETPMLTTSAREFGFSYVEQFVLPGSCPNASSIPLRAFLPLTIVEFPGPMTQDIVVTWELPDMDTARKLRYAKGKDGQFWLVYINQLNLPIVERLRFIGFDGTTVLAKARFPYEEHLLNGLTIAAVTNSSGPFANANAVAASTLYGPGVIIVN
ncbi:putative sexual development protein [Aspergillus campestris IBT 28561]|uniref:Sexual development protein n=1 Tax=Aspergillus campestris (strain IBT 28561) TaxID=1392248 RepID=A0A2I1DEX1_ASPC2|nr:putative sexual development protein [Aspergillus campestris IBT 28561]PKY08411.1 putative sexual development protein [Aspergillus campestris IBT 28561]